MMKDSIQAILVELRVDDECSLFVLLAEDGLVNRQGTGTVDNSERTLFVGRAKEPLFARLRNKIRPDWMAHQRAYDIPEKAGRICTLRILFRHGDGRETGFRFRYGSHSQGPPSDICDFVNAAVRLTDRWYEDQKVITNRTVPPVP